MSLLGLEAFPPEWAVAEGDALAHDLEIIATTFPRPGPAMVGRVRQTMLKVALRGSMVLARHGRDRDSRAFGDWFSRARLIASQNTDGEWMVTVRLAPVQNGGRTTWGGSEWPWI